MQQTPSQAKNIALQNLPRGHNLGLAFKQQHSKKPSLSFAQELAKLNTENNQLSQESQAQLNQEAELATQEQNFNQQSKLTKQEQNLITNLVQNNPDLLKQNKKLLEYQEQIQEVLRGEQNEQVLQDSEELASKFSTNETTTAGVSQENHKTITEAVKEGNAEQNQNYDQANDRKQQLTNWEDFAPRVTEDIKNRAVRVDIPGLAEVETIIVRMQGNAVAIQAVGDKTVMEKLQARESELTQKLGKHDVRLSKLQAFDANLVRHHHQQKKAAA